MLNLLDADKKLIEDFFEGIGEKKFRAAQTAAWLYRGAANFSEMTDLSKSLRLKLEEAEAAGQITTRFAKIKRQKHREISVWSCRWQRYRNSAYEV